VGSLLKNQHPHCPGKDGPRTEHCAGVSELFGGRDGGVQGAAASEPGAAPRLLRAAVEDVLAHGLPGLVPVAGCGAAGVVAVEWLVRARHSAGRRVWQLRTRLCQSDPGSLHNPTPRHPSNLSVRCHNPAGRSICLSCRFIVKGLTQKFKNLVQISGSPLSVLKGHKLSLSHTTLCRRSAVVEISKSFG
jgi:hypothetical protein